MGRAPDFIGLGAQRSGTSWIYACLYDHPQLCTPTKEVHFFSRDHIWRRGAAWYEGHFAPCRPGAVVGEFSTSYLPSVQAPQRIRDLYPAARLLVSLRHPVERLISNYLNDVMAGVVPATTPLLDALTIHPEYVEQGRYATQLERYLQYFPRAQILVLLYEEGLADPGAFIRQIYAFLGVDTAFQSSMLHRRVGEGRVPRNVFIERVITRGTWAVRGRLTRGVWWAAKRAGIGRTLRMANTANVPRPILPAAERARLAATFGDEIDRVERLLDRDLSAWRQ